MASTPRELTVRHPVAADRAGLEAALRSDDTFTAEEIGVALELVDSALEDERDYSVRVAEVPGHPIAGYVCFGRTPMTESTFDLYWVVVHKDARGRGVAAGLLLAMEAEIKRRGGRAVRVETSQQESHGAARHLYGKLGYPEAARFRNFYREGDDLIVYFKEV